MINWISFRTLLHREVIRFLKVINQTIFAPIISSSLYFIIFGLTIGSQIKDINGAPYFQFIIPGIIAMNVMMASYQNTSSSFFISKYMRLIDNLLVTPISYTELVLAHIIGGVFRGVLVGMLIWGVSLIFQPFPIAHPLAFCFFIIIIGIIFASVGLLVGLFSSEFEHLSVFSTYLVTPLTFLGGVFYSVNMLPDILKIITLLNPFFYIIDGFRFSMIGFSEGNLFFSVLMSIGTAFIFTGANIYLFSKGFKLKQ